MEYKTLIDIPSDRPFREFPSYTIPCLGNWFSYGGGGWAYVDTYKCYTVNKELTVRSLL